MRMAQEESQYCSYKKYNLYIFCGKITDFLFKYKIDISRPKLN